MHAPDTLTGSLGRKGSSLCQHLQNIVFSSKLLWSKPQKKPTSSEQGVDAAQGGTFGVEIGQAWRHQPLKTTGSLEWSSVFVTSLSQAGAGNRADPGAGPGRVRGTAAESFSLPATEQLHVAKRGQCKCLRGQHLSSLLEVTATSVGVRRYICTLAHCPLPVWVEIAGDSQHHPKGHRKQS